MSLAPDKNTLEIQIWYGDQSQTIHFDLPDGRNEYYRELHVEVCAYEQRNEHNERVVDWDTNYTFSPQREEE